MERVKYQDLNALVHRLNVVKGQPISHCERTPQGELVTAWGHYHLDRSAGGVQLAQYVGTQGQTAHVSYGGFIPKRELYGQIQAILRNH